jgi:WD40 repeat protein
MPDTRVGEVCRFIKHGDAVQTVGFTADGKNVLAWSGQTLRLWNIEGLNEARNLDVGDVQKVAVSSNGRLAAFARADGIHLVELATWKVTTLPAPEGKAPSAVMALAFNAGGRQVLSLGRDGALRLWDVEGKKSPRDYRSPLKGDVSSGVCAMTPDGEHILQGLGRDVRIVKAADDREVIRTTAHPQEVTAVIALPDNRQFVTAGREGALGVRTMNGGILPPPSDQAAAATECLAISSDGRWVLGQRGHTLRLIRLGDGKELEKFSPGAAHCAGVLARCPVGGFGFRGPVGAGLAPVGGTGATVAGGPASEKGREVLKIDARRWCIASPSRRTTGFAGRDPRGRSLVDPGRQADPRVPVRRRSWPRCRRDDW